ncbi:MAG: restriction endonuclease [Chthoniobacterales bacterium]
MRLLKKLLMKLVMLVIMVGVMGVGMRYGKPYIMKSMGMPEAAAGGGESIADAKFSSEESDLMGTILKSALKLFTGQAKREDLANELSDKLYNGRPGAEHMAELGIEIEKPGGKPSSAPPGMETAGASVSAPATPAEKGVVAAMPAAGAVAASAKPAAKVAGKLDAAPVPMTAAQRAANKAREALFGRLTDKAKANPELALVPVVVVGMLLFHFCRKRKSPVDDLMLPDLSNLLPSESEEYELKNPMHLLQAEEFELLVALIYQRQGYRIEMPAGLGSGRFMLLRKSERLFVQCKKLSQEHKVHVDRVREVHDAGLEASATRSMYVASCGFSWDARNFAKTKGVMVINARALDGLVTEAFRKTGEDCLGVSEWAPKLMTKVKLTPPHCPTCEAEMEQLSLSANSVWVCSQRPECKGRRSARKNYKDVPAAAPRATASPQPQATAFRKKQQPPEVKEVKTPQEVTEVVEAKAIMGGRARTICPSR